MGNILLQIFKNILFFILFLLRGFFDEVGGDFVYLIFINFRVFKKLDLYFSIRLHRFLLLFCNPLFLSIYFILNLKPRNIQSTYIFYSQRSVSNGCNWLFLNNLYLELDEAQLCEIVFYTIMSQVG